MESGTVLTCYEGSVGPTNENYEFAQNACNFTQEMWKSGNFTALKECLMKIDVQDGLAAAGVCRLCRYLNSNRPKHNLLEIENS
jgi:hypothetical protein